MSKGVLLHVRKTIYPVLVKANASEKSNVRLTEEEMLAQMRLEVQHSNAIQLTLT